MTQWLGGTSQLRVFHVQLLGTLVPINHCWVGSKALINQLLQPYSTLLG